MKENYSLILQRRLDFPNILFYKVLQPEIGVILCILHTPYFFFAHFKKAQDI
jgi:hypothetical protein